MKGFLKAISALALSALMLAGTCACDNSITDIRRRTREYEKRLTRQEQEEPKEATPPAESVPDETEKPDENAETDHNEEPNENKEQSGGEEQKKPPSRPPRKNRRPKPAPFPLPHGDGRTAQDDGREINA